MTKNWAQLGCQNQTQKSCLVGHKNPANVAWNLFYIPDGPALSILHCEIIPIANAAKFGVPPLAPSLQPLELLFRRQGKGTRKTPPLPPATSRTLYVTKQRGRCKPGSRHTNSCGTSTCDGHRPAPSFNIDPGWAPRRTSSPTRDIPSIHLNRHKV